jgi:hypothetical protein
MIAKRKQKGHGPKKTGSLVTFDNGGTQQFMLEFYETEILSVTPDKSDATTEEIKQVKFELFTERMTFKYGSKTS